MPIQLCALDEHNLRTNIRTIKQNNLMKKLPSELKPAIIGNLKLIRTSKQENLLQGVALTEQRCLNDTAWMAFENGKVSSDIGLQKYLTVIKSEQEVQHKAVRRNDNPLTTGKHKATFSMKCRLMALSRIGKQFTFDINNHITKQVVIGKNFLKLEKSTRSLRIFPSLVSKQIYNDRVQRTDNRTQSCHLSPVFYDHPGGKAKVCQSKWSYAELDGFIHSKAVMNHSSAKEVDVECNSQSYPCRGHTNKHNCLNQGLTIHCGGSRKFELCADLVGGQNVAMKTLLLRQDASQTEILVTAYPLKISLFRGNKIILSPCWENRRGVHWIFKQKQKKRFSF